MELSSGCVIRNRVTGVVRVVDNVYTEGTTGMKYAVFLYVDPGRSLEACQFTLYISSFEHISDDWEKVKI